MVGWVIIVEQWKNAHIHSEVNQENGALCCGSALVNELTKDGWSRADSGSYEPNKIEVTDYVQSHNKRKKVLVILLYHTTTYSLLNTIVLPLKRLCFI